MNEDWQLGHPKSLNNLCNFHKLEKFEIYENLTDTTGGQSETKRRKGGKRKWTWKSLQVTQKKNLSLFAFLTPPASSHSIHVARVEVVTVGRPKGKYTQHANFCGSRLSGGCSSWQAGRQEEEEGKRGRVAWENQFHIKIQANFMRTFCSSKSYCQYVWLTVLQSCKCMQSRCMCVCAGMCVRVCAYVWT